MKRIVGISLGSSSGDKTVQAEFFGEKYEISRIGTNGDQEKFNALLREYDGNADALCLGGLDRYLWSGGRRYEFRSVRQMIRGVTKTPMVDGSGLKNTLEREAVRWLQAEGIVDFRAKKTLMVCAVDRFGMAEALAEQGGKMVFGDLMFSLGLPLPIRSWKTHRILAPILLPLITQLPFEMLYPTGDKQDEITPKWGRYYDWADVIAGDKHLIRRYLPAPVGEVAGVAPTPSGGVSVTAEAPAPSLQGKTILTNTTTPDDVEQFKRRGVDLLVTSTPVFDGRSFGTNVMEGVFVAASGGRLLNSSEYREMLDRLNWRPNVQRLQD